MWYEFEWLVIHFKGSEDITIRRTGRFTESSTKLYVECDDNHNHIISVDCIESLEYMEKVGD